MSSANPCGVLQLKLGLRLGFQTTTRTARDLIISLPYGFEFRNLRRNRRPSFRPVAVIDDGSSAISTNFEESNGLLGGGKDPYVPASVSEGEESDTEILALPTTDVELPVSKGQLEAADASLTAAAYRFATIRHRSKRFPPGVLLNMGLITFLVMFLLFFDWYAWRIVRLPLEPFLFTQPFLISAVLSAFAGWLYVPIVDSMRIHQILRKEGPTTHFSKSRTPTMGGLFFVPVGLIVARCIVGNSIQVYGAAAATLAFAAIGLLDDLLSCIKSHNYGLSGWVKFSLQVAAGTFFAFWLDSANIPTQYNMKLFVPLPQPLGLIYLGKYYLALTAFCFTSMSNGVNLTDGLDGLAGGTAAWAFIGMSVAVLAVSPDLAIFGASMAGACAGFLIHNRYKASIFMGDTGSLALGGALAAMAACTGMFFPLFVSSGVFVMEVLSVIVQVLYMKTTKRLYGTCRRVFRMAPVHHHFELCGIKEPTVVASAYVVSCILALCAGYIGLISA